VTIDRHNALQTHAFWTAHSQVDPTTGASVEYAQQMPTAIDKIWLHAAYAAIHPDTKAGDKMIFESECGWRVPLHFVGGRVAVPVGNRLVLRS
jgi:hypothetical protein